MESQQRIDLNIENYSDKSFVIRGDSTREYKESLKALGGKWNSRLTDKENGSKFGAWLFWTEKRPEIERWLEQGCPIVEKTAESRIASADTGLQKIIKRVDRIEALLQKITNSEVIDGKSELVANGGNDNTRPKRLLNN